MGATNVKSESNGQGGDILSCCTECHVSSVLVEKQQKSRDESKYNQWSNSLRLTRKELMPLGNQVIPCTPHPDPCADNEYAIRFKLNDQIPEPFTNRRFMLDRRNCSRSPTPKPTPDEEHREPTLVPNKPPLTLDCHSPTRLPTAADPLSSPRAPRSPYVAARLSSPRTPQSPYVAAHYGEDERAERLGRLHHAVVKVSRHLGIPPPPASGAALAQLAAHAHGAEEAAEERDYGPRSAPARSSPRGAVPTPPRPARGAAPRAAPPRAPPRAEGRTRADAEPSSRGGARSS